VTGPVQEVRFCPWEGQTLPTSHDCVGATGGLPCPTPEGHPCGCCLVCLAAQAADPRYARPTEEETIPDEH
jgi:hypothetical protein